jgi:hypothetical protein
VAVGDRQLLLRPRIEALDRPTSFPPTFGTHIGPLRKTRRNLVRRVITGVTRCHTPAQSAAAVVQRRLGNSVFDGVATATAAETTNRPPRISRTRSWRPAEAMAKKTRTTKPGDTDFEAFDPTEEEFEEFDATAEPPRWKKQPPRRWGAPGGHRRGVSRAGIPQPGRLDGDICNDDVIARRQLNRSLLRDRASHAV